MLSVEQNLQVAIKWHMTYGIGVGVENTEADKESWLFSDHTEWALKREIFPQITTHWSIPEIYLFVSWLNTQLPRFVSWKCDPASCFVDAFTILGGIPCIFMLFHLFVKLTDV